MRPVSNRRDIVDEARRSCACGCGDSLAGMRTDALYRSEACRKRHERSESADKARTRRPSRNGLGVRLYITADELVLLGRALDRLGLMPTPRGDRFKAKLLRAADRIAERSA